MVEARGEIPKGRMHRSAPAQPNQSIIAGIRILQEVVSAPGPIGVQDLSQRLGVEVTKVSRLLGTLAYIGMVEQRSDRKYQPGSAVHVFAAQAMTGSHLLAAALPHLKVLHGEGIGVTIGHLWRDQNCYLFHADPEDTFEQGLGRTGLVPVNMSSAGMILLAFSENGLSVEGLRRLSIPGFNTQSGAKHLMLAFDGFRSQGFSVIHFPRGTISVGLPIGFPPIAGIALAQDIGIDQASELARTGIPVVEAIEKELGETGLDYRSRELPERPVSIDYPEYFDERSLS